jgi:hypothetical protein
VPEFGFSIDVPIRNQWEMVDRLRSSVKSCFSAVFSETDGCETVAMVTGELLENAIKYGDWSGGEQHFQLKVWGEGRHAVISVENPVRDDDASVRALNEILRWMKVFPTADEAYKARLLEIAETPAGERGLNRLGLVRIAYEGNCTLRAERPSPSRIRITAEVPF